MQVASGFESPVHVTAPRNQRGYFTSWIQTTATLGLFLSLLAILGVRLSTFVAATLIGIVPATVVFTLAGCGLGRALEAEGEFSLSNILTPEMIAALCGLALLALVPVVYKRYAQSAS